MVVSSCFVCAHYEIDILINTRTCMAAKSDYCPLEHMMKDHLCPMCKSRMESKINVCRDVCPRCGHTVDWAARASQKQKHRATMDF